MEEVVVQAADGRELQVRRKRRDGWTMGKRASFLDHLAATANVEAACRAVGMNSSGIFKLRRRNADFAEQWDAALDTAKARLRGMLIERSMGVPPAAAAEAGEQEEEALPIAPPPPDPRTMDTALALTMLKLHHLRADQKGPGPEILRRATREETDAAILRKLKALRKRMERK